MCACVCVCVCVCVRACERGRAPGGRAGAGVCECECVMSSLLITKTLISTTNRVGVGSRGAGSGLDCWLQLGHGPRVAHPAGHPAPGGHLILDPRLQQQAVAVVRQG